MPRKFIVRVFLSLLFIYSGACQLVRADDWNTSNFKPSKESAAIPDWNAGAASKQELYAAAEQQPQATNSSSGHAPRQLVGRIEELSTEASPMMPNDNVANRQMKAGRLVDSLPEAYLGAWTGKVTIDRSDYGVLKIRDPAMYRRESAILHPGRSGMGKVVFEHIRNGVKAVDPVAEFIPEPADEKFLDLVKDKMGPQTHFDVTFKSRHNEPTITGTNSSARVMMDDLRELDDNIFEEQITTKSKVIDTAKNTISFGTQETVLQFHLLSPKLLEITMASVHYARDDAMESKLLIHGILEKH